MALVDFRLLNGENVRIGIIDSGIDLELFKSANVKAGIKFSLDENDNVISSNDVVDNIGHGTAVASIILKKAPKAEIYPIKIFDKKLVVKTILVRESISWCISNKIDIINLSLGAESIDGKELLEKVCQEAIDKNIIIVAAAANDDKICYPAMLDKVLGVTSGKVLGKYKYYFEPKQTIQFIARGDNQRVSWINRKKIILGGNSYAAPHITAIVALIIQKYVVIKYDELCNILLDNSLKTKPQNNISVYNNKINSKLRVKNISKLKLNEIHTQNKLNWIKKALLYPYNEEMHSFIRFRNLLKFKIIHVVDNIGEKSIGKDSGEYIGAGKSDIIIRKDLTKCLQDVDTIILGSLTEISKIKKRNLLKDVLKLAIAQKKNIYSLYPLNAEYEDYLVQFSDNKIKIKYPDINYSDYEKITSVFNVNHKSKKPIIGVFGTSPHQGKFTLQLLLRQELLKLGYKVGQIGTGRQSALFNFDFTFPSCYNSEGSIKIPMGLHISFLQAVMVGIENNDSDIIIVGGQPGITPFILQNRTFLNTISSIQVLLGTLPDAYILVVNYTDNFEYIKDNINALKALGKGKTILIVFSDQKKSIINDSGRTYIHYEKLTSAEISEISKVYNNSFGIPATEIISEKGKELIVSTVINYFKQQQ